MTQSFRKVINARSSPIASGSYRNQPGRVISLEGGCISYFSLSPGWRLQTPANFRPEKTIALAQGLLVCILA